MRRLSDGEKGLMKADLDTGLSRLPTMKTEQLRALWHELFGKPPHPKLRRELLIPIIAYRMQEKALGGLKPSTLRRLQSAAAQIRAGKKLASSQVPCARPGTRMVRQWQGKLYEVVTVESGFLCDGQKYRSLSEIARAITGTRWSGPAFFGLKNRKAEEAA